MVNIHRVWLKARKLNSAEAAQQSSKKPQQGSGKITKLALLMENI
jgi:hypothetical protein